MANLTASIHSYADAEKFLAGKTARKLGNNTYVESIGHTVTAIAVRLHATNIVTYHPDGTIVLNTGGWNTVTTRDRMHQLTPRGVSVSGSKGDRSGRAEDLNVTAYRNVDTGEVDVIGWPITERVTDFSATATSAVTITTEGRYAHEVLNIEGDRA